MGQLVRRGRCVGRIALVVLQCRQRADQIVAGVENRQPGTNGAVRILARLQQLMQRQPSGDAFIAAFDKIQSAVREQFYRASAGFLPSVPQIGRRETAVDVFSRRLTGKHLRRCIRNDESRTVEFAVDHAVSVRILRDPKRCQHIQTVVDGQAAPPVVRDGIRLYNMQVA